MLNCKIHLLIFYVLWLLKNFISFSDCQTIQLFQKYQANNINPTCSDGQSYDFNNFNSNNCIINNKIFPTFFLGYMILNEKIQFVVYIVFPTASLTFTYWVYLQDKSCSSDILNFWALRNPSATVIYLQYSQQQQKLTINSDIVKNDLNNIEITTNPNKTIQLNNWYFMMISLDLLDTKLYILIYDPQTILFLNGIYNQELSSYDLDTENINTEYGLKIIPDSMSSFSGKFHHGYITNQYINNAPSTLDFTLSSNQPVLYAYYQFNENVGQFIYDSSNNSYHGINGVSASTNENDFEWQSVNTYTHFSPFKQNKMTQDNSNGALFLTNSIAYLPTFPFIIKDPKFNSFTFDFWIKLNDTSTTSIASIFSKSTDINQIYFALNVDISNGLIRVLFGSDYLECCTNAIGLTSTAFTRLIINFIYFPQNTFIVYSVFNPEYLGKINDAATASITETNTDITYIGGLTNPFIGYLRLFKLYSGSIIQKPYDDTNWQDHFLSLGFNLPEPIIQSLSQCESGSYLDTLPSDTVCTKCDIRCTDCSSGNPNSCNSCNRGYQLQSSTSKCDCPSNYIISKKYALCSNSSCITSIQSPSSNCVSSCSSTEISDSLICMINNCPLNYNKDSITDLCMQNCISDTTINSNTRYCQSSSCSSSSNQYVIPKTRACTSSCPNGFYSDEVSKMCVSFCSSQLFIDIVNSKCVMICPSNYYGNILTRNCENQCPNNLYTDEVNQLCVISCSTTQYKEETLKKCYNSCPSNYYSDIDSKVCLLSCSPKFANSNKNCVTSCESGTYGDQNTNTCVSQCSSSTYANQATNMCVNTCPSGTYANQTTNMCVQTCPSGTYGDNTTNMCVQTCPSGAYGYQTTNMCVNTCPSGTYANQATSMCVQTCSSGKYGDKTTNMCVNSCSSGTYGDQNAKLCVNTCPSGTYANQATSICVQTCPSGTYGDKTTNMCVNSCPSTYYADDPTNLCVQNCPSPRLKYLAPPGECVTACPQYYFSDLTIMKCSTTCSSGTYADSITNNCTNLCSVGYFGNNDTYTCVQNEQSCPNGSFGDSILRLCVSKCSPETFGDATSKKCLITCPTNQYRDSITNLCTTECSSPNFGDNTTWACVSKCPNGTFGDSLNKRMCVDICTTATYGDSSKNECVIGCPENFFADPSHDNLCVATCSSTLYGNPTYRYCQENCTTPYFGDSTAHLCVISCPNGTFGAQIGTIRQCLEDATLCPSGQYGDPNSNLCVAQCPVNYYGENSTKLCVASCPNNTFEDDSSRLCIAECSPQTFGISIQRKCVINVTSCPESTPYGDQTNKLCVLTCPNQEYINKTTRLCVTSCSPNYGNTLNMTCVTSCPYSLYTDIVNKFCVATCPINLFTDMVNKRCNFTCPVVNTYEYTNQGTCIGACPIHLFGDTINKKCVSTCPTTLYTNMFSRLCVRTCSFPLYIHYEVRMCYDICPKPYYSDTVNRVCTLTCPIELFSYNASFTCVALCPTGLYGDNVVTHSCVETCPTQSYTDQVNMMCVMKCPSNLFINDMQCIAKCPALYYGDLTTMNCVSSCPSTLYTNDIQMLCNTTCPLSLYTDIVNLKCVSSCPLSLYTITLNKTCVSDCPSYKFLTQDKECVSVCRSDLLTNIVDNSCITQCPSNLYTDILYKRCNVSCPLDLYTDDIHKICSKPCQNLYTDLVHKTCVENCNSSVLLYTNVLSNECNATCPLSTTYQDESNKKCVLSCSTTQYIYAENKSCYDKCPLPLYGNTQTKRCVSVCPSSILANKKDYLCVNICPNDTYTDYIYNECVESCPLSLYAYENNKTCLQRCPTNYFGKSPDMFCVLYCGPEKFSDNLTNLCVDNCPAGYYKDLSTYSCVTKCPQDYFLNKSNLVCTNSCKPLFGDLLKMECTSLCPSGYFQNTLTYLCTSSCAGNQFADKIRNVCVSVCPVLTYGNPLNRICSPTCPTSYFKNIQTRMCEPICSSGFGHPISLDCVGTCLAPYLSQTSSKTCVTDCFNFEKNNGTACVPICDTTQFYNITIKTCQDCDPSCESCQFNGTYCLSCKNITGIDYLMLNNCTSQCLDGYYPDSNKVCQPCHSYCNTCDGPNDNNCTSCNPNSSYQFLYKKTCSSSCSGGMYGNTTLGICKQCDPDCLTCNGDSSSSCLSCSNTKPLIYSQSCYAACPPNTFASSSISCQKCHQNCSNCEGPLSTQCTSCPINLPYFSDGTCLSTCKIKFYPDGNNICKSCDKSCKTCSGSEANQCLSCPTFYWLLDGMCSKNLKCGNGKYRNGTVCISCDSSCTNCDITSTNCTSCEDGWYLTKDTNNQGLCMICSQNCTNCFKSPTNCTSCSSQYGLALNKLTSEYSCFDLTYADIIYDEAKATITYIYNQTLGELTKNKLAAAFIISMNNIKNSEFTTQTKKVNNTIVITLTPKKTISNSVLQITYGNIILIKDINGLPVMNQTFQKLIQMSNILSESSIKAAGVVANTKSASQAAIVGFIMPLLIFSGGLVALWALIDSMQEEFYYVFINITIPENFKIFLSIFRLFGDILPNLAVILQDELQSGFMSLEFPSVAVPDIFSSQGYDGFFLDEGGSLIIYIMLITIKILIIYNCLKKSNRIRNNSIYNYILNLNMKWNELIRFIILNHNRLIFLCLLQLWSFEMSTKLLASSVICSMITLISMIGFAIWGLWLLLKYLKFNKYDRKNRIKYRSFYEGLKYKASKPCKIFLIILLIKRGLAILPIILLYYYPMANLIVLCIFDAIIAIMVIIIKPYRQKFNNYMCFLDQFTFFIVKIILLIIYIANFGADDDILDHLGWLMIAINFLLLISKFYFVLKEAMNIYKKIFSGIKDYILMKIQRYHGHVLRHSRTTGIPELTLKPKKTNQMPNLTLGQLKSRLHELEIDQKGKNKIQGFQRRRTKQLKICSDYNTSISQDDTLL